VAKVLVSRPGGQGLGLELFSKVLITSLEIRHSVHSIDCDRISGKMSLVKLLSGRKRQSVVWEYFVYEEHHDKSRCTVLNDKGEPCGVRIAGMYHHFHYHAHHFLHALYVGLYVSWRRCIFNLAAFALVQTF